MQTTSETASPALQRLAALPRSERRTVLEELVVDEFKQALSMAQDDEFAIDESFFDIGCTSLRLLEIAKRLEELLGRPVSTNQMFNNPTIEDLLDHIIADLLPAAHEGGIRE